jgi:hypothetical protein
MTPTCAKAARDETAAARDAQRELRRRWLLAPP